jgi:hypothetical protein
MGGVDILIVVIVEVHDMLSFGDPRQARAFDIVICTKKMIKKEQMHIKIRKRICCSLYV